MKKKKCMMDHLKVECLLPIPSKLLIWYDHVARKLPWRIDHSSYRVWVSEVMLQQTRVEAVIPYFERFMSALPNLAALAHASEDQLLKLWEGLGYYSRVRNLQRAAKEVLRSGRKELPQDYQALLSLPGIGAYTAGAIASIAFGIQVPAVDGNVLRVLSRLFACGKDISLPAIKHMFEEAARSLVPAERPGDFNQAMMELGATVCLPHTAPHCDVCPISDYCRAHLNGNAEDYPYKAPKKPRVIEERTILLVIACGHVLLQRRPTKGLLAGMWEFPNYLGWFEDEEKQALLIGLGMGNAPMRPLGESKHIFTHREWKLRGTLVMATDCIEVEGAIWASGEDLNKKYALPSAYQYFSKQLPKLFDLSMEEKWAR